MQQHYKSFYRYINTRYDRFRMGYFTMVSVLLITALWFSNKSFFASCLAANYLFFAGLFLIINYISYRRYLQK